MASLVVEHVSKVFSTDGPPVAVLRDIDIALDAGESMAILGPSGSGKSTLLSIIGTLERPTSGSVRLAGTDPYQLDSTALATFRRRNIGFVFQDHLLLPHLTALENVLIPILAAGKANHADCQRAMDLLDRVGLSHRLHHRPGAMSGGEQQRTALARALIHRPALVLADEPTGNLDQANSNSVGDLLRQLQLEHGVMLLVATHSLELAGRFDQRRGLENGTLCPDLV